MMFNRLFASFGIAMVFEIKLVVDVGCVCVQVNLTNMGSACLKLQMTKRSYGSPLFVCVCI